MEEQTLSLKAAGGGVAIICLVCLHMHVWWSEDSFKQSSTVGPRDQTQVVTAGGHLYSLSNLTSPNLDFLRGGGQRE